MHRRRTDRQTDVNSNVHAQYNKAVITGEQAIRRTLLMLIDVFFYDRLRGFWYTTTPG